MFANKKRMQSYANKSVNYQETHFFSPQIIHTVFFFSFSSFKMLFSVGPDMSVHLLICAFAHSVFKCFFFSNERCIIANFLERYLHLIEDNKVHGGYSVGVDRAIRAVFYECLAVSRCGLHCEDMLILEHDSNSLGHNLSTGLQRTYINGRVPFPHQFAQSQREVLIV